MKASRKIQYLIQLTCLLLIAACATQPQQAPVDETAVAAEAAAQAERTEPTSTDLMYNVFAGEFLGSEDDMQRAADHYLEAALESEDPEIAARATRVAIAANAWQHATMAADRWVLLHPENIDARQTAARTMIVVGDYVGAEHHLNGILEQMSSDGEQAWALVASLLSTSGNIEKSAQILDRLIEDNQAQDNPDALIAKSRYLAAREELDEAWDMVRRAIEMQPGRAEYHAWAGRIAVNLDLVDQAMEHYRIAWTLRPDSERVAMAYAQLLVRNEETERAQDVLAGLADTPSNRFTRIAFALDSQMRERAEDIYAGYENANYENVLDHAFYAAQAAELLDLPAQAANWYAQVTKGERMLVAALRRAYLTADSGDLEAARNQLAQLRLQHDTAIARESYLAESEILNSANQPETAHELLTSALEVNPGDTGLLYGRAMIAVQLDRIEDAEIDLREIITAEPDNAAALNALGYTLADRKLRYDEAESLIRAAFELQPDEVSIIDSMGWIAYRQGRLEEAERYLRDAWSRDDNAEIGAHLGEVLWMAEQKEEAVVIWNEALSTDPSNAVLLETMHRFGLEP